MNMDTRNAATLATLKTGEPLNGIEYYAFVTLIKANLRQFSTEVRRQVLDLAMELAEYREQSEAEERLRSQHALCELK